MNVWFHRISHEARVAYPLLEEGFLTIGFSDLLTNHENVVLDIKDGKLSDQKFNEIFQDAFKCVRRNRWYLWDFATFAVGDYVVVPSWGTFAVYKVLATAQAVKHLPASVLARVKDWNDKSIFLNKDNGIGYIDDKGKEMEYDLGFFVTVEPATSYNDGTGEVTPFAPRQKFLNNALTRRLKSRGTNGQMNDLQADVLSVIERINQNNPLNFAKTVFNSFSAPLKSLIQNELNDDKFELLVKWYMEKIGADKVEIPSKNAANKPVDGDADVVAYFEKLKLIVYIQAKHYSGTQANDWAINQIQNYVAGVDNDEGYTCAAWVVSSCDDYGDDVKQSAKQAISQGAMSPIRLIDGGEFATILLDVGFGGLKDADIF